MTQIICIMLALLTFSSSSWAIKIIQKKETKILLQLDGEFAEVEQKVILFNTDAKKIAIAKIIQIKNDRAIAEVYKGNAANATSAELYVADSNITDKNDSPIYKVSSTKLSFLLNYTMNTMSTKQTDGSNPTPNVEDVGLTGSGIGLTAALDLPLSQWFTLRGTLGYEPFVAQGTATYLSCDGLSSRDCNVNINYLAAGAYARFDFSRSKATFWGALGMTFRQPISKATTALIADDIQFTTNYAAAFGLDLFISNSSFIPLSLEYQLYQNSETVSANSISARIGYGFAF